MSKQIEKRLAALETDTPYLGHEDWVRLLGGGVDVGNRETWPIDLRDKQSDPRHAVALEVLA